MKAQWISKLETTWTLKALLSPETNPLAEAGRLSIDSDWPLVEHKLCRYSDDHWEAGRRKKQQPENPNKTNKMSAAAAPGETDATIIQERHKQTGSQTNNPPEAGSESRFSTLYCLTDPGRLWLRSQTETSQTKETADQHPS